MPTLVKNQIQDIIDLNEDYVFMYIDRDEFVHLCRNKNRINELSNLLYFTCNTTRDRIYLLGNDSLLIMLKLSGLLKTASLVNEIDDDVFHTVTLFANSRI
jgi:hypothetical protein